MIVTVAYAALYCYAQRTVRSRTARPIAARSSGEAAAMMTRLGPRITDPTSNAATICAVGNVRKPFRRDEGAGEATTAIVDCEVDGIAKENSGRISALSADLDAAIRASTRARRAATLSSWGGNGSFTTPP